MNPTKSSQTDWGLRGLFQCCAGVDGRWTTATRLVIVVLLACSVGCLADQPIASGSPETVTGLLGTWRCLHPDTTNPSVVTVTADGRGLRAVFSEVDPKDSSSWTAYAVKSGGERFLNVQMEGDDEWTVAQYSLYRPGVLHVEYPQYGTHTFKGATPTQRRDALRRALKTKTLFDDSFTCVRIPGTASQK